MLKKKTETIKFNDFMNGSYKEKKKKDYKSLDFIPMGALTGIGVMEAFKVDKVQAQGLEDMLYEKIGHAFDPLIDVIQGIAYPITFVVLLVGGLFLVVGSKDRGITMITNGCIGYLVIQTMDLLMALMVEIAKAM